ncbi:hypothetical protein CRE_29555 [Caenorhabditis remanei]|uniref:CHK kinase-like domain-containing protein n=1 Tax=Caenorhabditis remanei TaxID=31234 RepID=E3LVN0_CAERE|nr:hypothetical protein CRE_29555 [Caenorhabditis remanei]
MTVKPKTILENGDGLFNTHVTVEDLEEVIQDQMKTNSKLGKNTKYTVIGEGNIVSRSQKLSQSQSSQFPKSNCSSSNSFLRHFQGIMSRIILVEPQWTISDDHLPSKFVLKIPYCVHIQGLIGQMIAMNPMSEEQEAGLWAMWESEIQSIHNREVNINKIVEKWNKREDLLNPRVYFSKKYDSENRNKGFIGMEYAEDSIVRHLYVNVKPRELYPVSVKLFLLFVLKFVAHFQASGLHLTDEEKQSISGFDIEKIAGPLMSEDGIKGILQQVRMMNPEKFDEKVKKIEAFGMEIVNFELASNLNKYVGIDQPVLVHGDLWATNVLWKEKKEEWIVSKIIDYQGIHMGNPAEDLVRLFVSTLSGPDRQKYWEKLLEKFYKFFLEALQSQNAPYSLEQLKESYRCYFVFGGVGLVQLMGPVTQRKLTMCSPDENVEEYQKVVLGKMEHLLDDVEKFHLHSRNVTKSYKKPVTRI